MTITTRRTPPLASALLPVILILTLLAAGLHFYEAIAAPDVRLLFTLNGVVWLALLAAYTLPIPALAEYRRPIRWLLAGYAALTIAAFFVWNILKGQWTPLGWITTAIEVALVVLLLLADRQAEAAR